MSSQNKIESSLFRPENMNQDQNYNPQPLSIDQVHSEHKNRSSDQKLLEGQWTSQQCIKYIVFMHIYNDIFNCKTKRKNLQIFKKLSEFLGTRTARQCRSHFQKLKNRFGTLVQMRKHWKKELGAQVYEEYYQAIQKQLESFEIKFPTQKKLITKQTQEIGTQTEQVICLSQQQFDIFYRSYLQNQQQRSSGNIWVNYPSYTHYNENTMVIPQFR